MKKSLLCLAMSGMSLFSYAQDSILSEKKGSVIEKTAESSDVLVEYEKTEIRKKQKQQDLAEKINKSKSVEEKLGIKPRPDDQKYDPFNPKQQIITLEGKNYNYK